MVYLHDTIETAGLEKEDVPALRDRVWEAVAGPVHAAMDAAAEAVPAKEARRELD